MYIVIGGLRFDHLLRLVLEEDHGKGGGIDFTMYKVYILLTRKKGFESSVFGLALYRLNCFRYDNLCTFARTIRYHSFVL